MSDEKETELAAFAESVHNMATKSDEQDTDPVVTTFQALDPRSDAVIGPRPLPQWKFASRAPGKLLRPPITDDSPLRWRSSWESPDLTSGSGGGDKPNKDNNVAAGSSLEWLCNCENHIHDDKFVVDSSSSYEWKLPSASELASMDYICAGPFPKRVVVAEDGEDQKSPQQPMLSPLRKHQQLLIGGPSDSIAKLYNRDLSTVGNKSSGEEEEEEEGEEESGDDSSGGGGTFRVKDKKRLPSLSALRGLKAKTKTHTKKKKKTENNALDTKTGCPSLYLDIAMPLELEKETEKKKNSTIFIHSANLTLLSTVCLPWPVRAALCHKRYRHADDRVVDRHMAPATGPGDCNWDQMDTDRQVRGRLIPPGMSPTSNCGPVIGNLLLSFHNQKAWEFRLCELDVMQTAHRIAKSDCRVDVTNPGRDPLAWMVLRFWPFIRRVTLAELAIPEHRKQYNIKSTADYREISDLKSVPCSRNAMSDVLDLLCILGGFDKIVEISKPPSLCLRLCGGNPAAEELQKRLSYLKSGDCWSARDELAWSKIMFLVDLEYSVINNNPRALTNRDWVLDNTLRLPAGQPLDAQGRFIFRSVPENVNHSKEFILDKSSRQDSE